MATSTRAFVIDLGGRSALLPMDGAVEYLRSRLWRVLPAYVVGMAPYSLVVLMLIDIITAQHRSALPLACVLLTFATAWRWLWQAQVQRRVQEDLLGEPPLPLRERWMAYLLVRTYANLALTWGGFLVLPGAYGLMISGFAAPMLLENKRAAGRQVKEVISWISQWFSRIMRVMSALGGLVLMTLISALALQFFVTGTLLPSLLGLDTTQLSLTVSSFAWTLCIFYFLFLLFDFYWTVLSVMLYYDLQSRRLGTDLRVRLRRLQEEQA